MSRTPRRRPTEPPTTILTLTAPRVDYAGADLSVVADRLGITSRPVPRVPFDPGTHPLHRRFFTDGWGADAPPYDATAADLGVSLPDVVSGVVVEVCDRMAVSA
jgi:hypothetical protein